MCYPEGKIIASENIQNLFVFRTRNTNNIIHVWRNYVVEIAIINSMQTVSSICFCTDSNVSHECICLKVFIPRP